MSHKKVLKQFKTVRLFAHSTVEWKKSTHSTSKNFGKRLAYATQAVVYGQKHAPQSPEYSASHFDDESTIITFKNVGGGLKLATYS